MKMRGYAIIVAAFFTVSIAYGIRYGYGMLLPGMIESLEIGKTEAGIIYASYFVAYTLFSPLLGLLSDRYDSRLILTVFPALMAAGALLMSFAATAGQAAVFFSLAGIGHAACWAPVVSLVQLWVKDSYRGTALGFATMGSGVGIASWGMILPVVVERSSWQAGWYAMGIFGLFVALLNSVLVRNPPGENKEQIGGEKGRKKGKRERAGPSYMQILKRKQLWLIGFSYLLIGFIVLVPFTFLGVYGVEELHLTYRDATRLFSLLAVSGMVGKIIFGFLSDKWGRIQVMMLCGGLLGFGCLGIAGLSAFPLKICSVVMVGLGFGAVWPVYAAAAMDFFPRAVSGTVIGLWTVFLGIGSILSPVICGWTIDRSGSYFGPFMIGFIASIFSVLLLVPGLKQSGVTTWNAGE
jgi:ACS family D-galactonate transporter-like MFS transporter